MSPAELDEMIEEATVDAYGESEQVTGFFTLLEERLKFPFQTEMLGMEVTVQQVDLTDCKSPKGHARGFPIISDSLTAV